MEVRYLKEIKDSRFININTQQLYANNKNRHLYGLYIENQLIGLIGILADYGVEIVDLIIQETYEKEHKQQYLINYVKKKYINKDIIIKDSLSNQSFYNALGFTTISDDIQNITYYIYKRKDHLVDRYLNISGDVETYPVDWDNKQLVLDYIMKFFQTDKNYTEKEVNELIKEHILFDDYAIIRRDLCDSQRIQRTADNQTYWVK